MAAVVGVGVVRLGSAVAGIVDALAGSGEVREELVVVVLGLFGIVDREVILVLLLDVFDAEAERR